MRGKERIILRSLVPFLLLSFVVPCAWANKSSVSIEAPHAAKKGSEVEIKIHVSHNANNIFHYTKLAYVKADGEQLERWDYSWRDRPDGEEFTKRVTFTFRETTEVVAEASCNLHGGRGPVRWVIKLENQ